MSNSIEWPAVAIPPGGARKRLQDARTETLLGGIAPDGEASDDVFAPGRIVGDRYRIRSLLGRGGMGVVWRAFDLKLRVELALKSLPPDSLKDKKRRRLLRSEVRAARQVISPNVCRIFDLIEVGGRELVSMEYIDGETLIALLEQRSPLGLAEAQNIASQFLAGLEAIHEAGLVHRDVKPENIMITRARRVVLMDFGLALQKDCGSAAPSGTPGYMAPEQAARLEVGTPADVYAAGVVLTEMACPHGIRNLESRRRLWKGIRLEPPLLPDSPWAPVLRRATDKESKRRYDSARSLARALEEVTLRVDGAENLKPYPGLAAFEESDAAYFFGREAEIEQMWRRLKSARLLAVVGPSGAGKSSFLRAGLMASAELGWRIVCITPGTAATRSLARGIGSELAEGEAAQNEPSLDNLDEAVALIGRWRRRHDRALLIVDQFEELFTLNMPDEQARFAELLGRLPLEADTHVLLGMRDDFLTRCNAFEPLRPVYNELTVLDPPTGSNLRRALVQPAVKCGYRFEEDKLVEEMLSDVGGERGELPMLAFAAAKLWERRDREKGLLTRKAYREVGGVTGALAKHAEQNLTRLGPERLPVVRELFRNLVTAEGTRLVRETEELLSVFDETRRDSARDVLTELIKARLFTTYELTTEDGRSVSQIEIIHESLLSSWPRLVGWRTQDADSARLKDELRQAARIWAEHGHSDDLLWTRTAYREFSLWRERYPGGLSELEEDFARAMTVYSKRSVRRRRLAVAVAFVALLTVLGIVGVSRKQAIVAANRSEAGKLVALGRLELGSDSREYCPSSGLAYAIAAIKRHDSPETRRFSLESLWRGPAGFAVSSDTPWIRPFSADGEWLAQPTKGGEILIWPRSATAPFKMPIDRKRFPGWWFVEAQQEPDVLAVGLTRPRVVEFWSVQDRELLLSLDADTPCRIELGEGLQDPGNLGPSAVGRRACFEKRNGRMEVRELPLRTGEPRVLGALEASSVDGAAISGRLLVTFADRTLRLHDLDRLSLAATTIGRHDSPVVKASVSAATNTLLSADRAGTIKLWSLGPEQPRILGSYQAPPGLSSFAVDRSVGALASASASDGTTWLRDLHGPPDAEPLVLHRKTGKQAGSVSFEPQGQWLATAEMPSTLMLWPLTRRHPYVLSRELGTVWDITFHPKSDAAIVGSQDGTVTLWPLTPSAGETSRVLFRAPQGPIMTVDADPEGRWVVAGNRGGPWRIPLEGGEARKLAGFESTVWAVAVSPNGRYAAGAGGHADFSERFIRIWNLSTGEVVQVLGPPDENRPGSGQILRLLYTPDGKKLISSGWTGMLVWDLAQGSYEYLGDGVVPAISRDGKSLFVAWSDWEGLGGAGVYDLESGSLRTLPSHGKSGSIALSTDEATIVTGGIDGAIRVGPADGGEPHTLLGHRGFTVLKISPDGRWIVSGSTDGSLRAWPMPDVSQAPLHTLPRSALIAKLESLTNYRAVADGKAVDGYRVEPEPFAGWGESPRW